MSRRGWIRITFPSWVDDLDEKVDQAWDTLRGQPVLDQVFYGASEIGDFSKLWHAAGVTRGVMAGDHREALRLALALGAESALVNGLIKSVFQRDRPEADPAERPLHLRQPKTSSFPSGHASSAFMAAGLIAPRSRAGVTWYGVAAIVAASRIHVRIHHASDVVAGAALGVVLARVVERIAPVD
ncbi:MAG: phosphatase PAP2 family protein [Actinomycetia bacterium]|nr:phosphatase PAP2 family protein [Actinomycetes bacterium]